MIGNDISKLKYSPVDVCLLRFNRAEEFKELRAGLKLCKNDIKLIYAWVGDGMTREDMLKACSIFASPEDAYKRTDYALVFSFTGRDSGKDMVWVETPVLFSPKSLNTFVYYKENNNLADYFSDYLSSPVAFEKKILTEYLMEITNLSVRPKLANEFDAEGNKLDDPMYWKRPEHAISVVKALSEISVMYRPRL